MPKIAPIATNTAISVRSSSQLLSRHPPSMNASIQNKQQESMAMPKGNNKCFESMCITGSFLTRK